MIEAKLTQYLSSLTLGKEPKPSTTTLTTFSKTAAKAVETIFEQKKDRRFPRASALGHGARRLWFMRQFPDVAEDFNINTRMTFIQGHLLEAVVILFLKEAGVEIEQTQTSGKAKYGEWEVSGTIDVIIDGKIWDIKAVNGWSFKSKFKDAISLAQNDGYGYIEQAATYELTHKLPFGGWIVVNREAGEIKVIDADPIREVFPKVREEIQEKLSKAYGADMPSQCYNFVWETYKKNKTGRIVADSRCSRCPFNDKCFPNFKRENKSNGLTIIIQEKEEYDAD
jgi:hypothetical protein